MNSIRSEAHGSTARADAVADAQAATRQLHSATEALLDAAAERYGITRNDLRCLEILERKGTMQPGQLAQASGLSRAAITKVLDRLECAGYITRSSEREDRRSYHVQTSDHLADQRRATWQPVLRATDGALSGLSVTQLQDLTAVLLRLADANRQSVQQLR
ncbi:MarR family winged helix-turn-helix transcriptional regulator [Brachybacterium sp. P6-10-X1]|uniref:MarR family winged helix-turn-helix transcriptional regulator n=1 Tax=Brachybacterium sp. P6-10-X1 TaxID=1903186 RepID=UPI001561158E|nr:MarR family transcriptional regulator [Brachybacterium sp. P6-10-X1]